MGRKRTRIKGSDITVFVLTMLAIQDVADMVYLQEIKEKIWYKIEAILIMYMFKFPHDRNLFRIQTQEKHMRSQTSL
ncbi:MAG: hypothetical protein FIB08_14840 [Candidatus Methanoperedens sp.]|nr:hypothetical protein [Candidatus Methanoperedens sp.]